jgi:hypothetical protein
MLLQVYGRDGQIVISSCVYYHKSTSVLEGIEFAGHFFRVLSVNLLRITVLFIGRGLWFACVRVTADRCK